MSDGTFDGRMGHGPSLTWAPTCLYRGAGTAPLALCWQLDHFILQVLQAVKLTESPVGWSSSSFLLQVFLCRRSQMFWRLGMNLRLQSRVGVEEGGPGFGVGGVALWLGNSSSGLSCWRLLRGEAVLTQPPTAWSNGISPGSWRRGSGLCSARRSVCDLDTGFCLVQTFGRTSS